MADEELELDVNEKKGGKKTVIMVIVGILLLNGLGVGAWMILSDGDSKSSDSAEKDGPVLAPLHYLTMVPEFIVNFGPGSKVRYLQVDLQVATRDEAALETINTYRPVIRNDVLVLLSSVKFDDLKDRAGKEALQKKLLNAINKVVISASHIAPVDGEEKNADAEEKINSDVKDPIENVYFTSFIMQ